MNQDTAAETFLFRRLSALLLGLIFLALAAAPGIAQFDFSGAGNGKDDAPEAGEEVQVRALASKSAVVPGDQLAVAVVFDHAPGWHIHTNDPVIPPEFGDFTVVPTVIAPREIPEAVSVGPIQWPEVHEVEVAFTGEPVMCGVFEGEAIAYLPILLSENAPVGETLTLSLEVEYQACDDVQCLFPATDVFTIELPVIAREAAAAAESLNVESDVFDGFDLSVFSRVGEWGDPARAPSEDVVFNAFGLEFAINPGGALGFGLLLLVAALGGALLNFTPCVLPVIPIKIMGLSQAAGNPAKCFALGFLMSVGVVVFWMAIGMAIAFVQGFDSISGLFQRPWFSVIVGLFIALMAVGMLGLYTIRLPDSVYMLNPSHDSYHGSFLFGIMTAILATPCVAPFMGAAAAWAATQTPGVTLSTFGAIGAGMALPYLVLSANPKWVSKIPRTGPGSELVKQVMGLIMLAVTSYFLGVGISGLAGDAAQAPSRIYWWFVVGFLALAGLWLIYRTWRITSSTTKRAVFTAIGLIAVVGAIPAGLKFSSHGPVNWVYYTPETFDRASDRNDVVVIDFTAEWCLNCKAMEEAVLYRDQVATLLNGPGVTPIKVDLTSENPEGQAKLRELGARGIPLLAIYGPALEDPLTFEFYTIEMVVKGIAAARGEDQPPSRADAAPPPARSADSAASPPAASASPAQSASQR